MLTGDILKNYKIALDLALEQKDLYLIGLTDLYNESHSWDKPRIKKRLAFRWTNGVNYNYKNLWNRYGNRISLNYKI